MSNYEVVYYDGDEKFGKFGKKTTKIINNVSEIKDEKNITTFVVESGNNFVCMSGRIISYKKLN
jgi:general stress protein 26